MAASLSRTPTLRYRLRRWLTDNPVVLKELRGRMRGARAFIVLTLYLGLLGAFSSLIYFAVSEAASQVSGQVNVGDIGRTLFAGVVAIEMLLVAFIAPSFTAGTISGEREHQTYDLLRTTLLPAHWLVWGKLLSALSFVVLLLLSAIPLQSIAFFFGGVTETEVILSLVILLATALLFSTIGLYFSARSRRTLTASVLTYAAAAFVMFGLPIVLASVLWIIEPSLNTVQSTRAEQTLVYVLGLIISTNPVATAIVAQSILINQRTAGTFAYTLNSGQDMTLISPWIPFVILYLGFSLLFFALAVRRVRALEE